LPVNLTIKCFPFCKKESTLLWDWLASGTGAKLKSAPCWANSEGIFRKGKGRRCLLIGWWEGDFSGFCAGIDGHHAISRHLCFFPGVFHAQVLCKGFWASDVKGHPSEKYASLGHFYFWKTGFKLTLSGFWSTPWKTTYALCYLRNLYLGMYKS
jgi:hypothetical protein